MGTKSSFASIHISHYARENDIIIVLTKCETTRYIITYFTIIRVPYDYLFISKVVNIDDDNNTFQIIDLRVALLLLMDSYLVMTRSIDC